MFDLASYFGEEIQLQWFTILYREISKCVYESFEFPP